MGLKTIFIVMVILFLLFCIVMVTIFRLENEAEIEEEYQKQLICHTPKSRWQEHCMKYGKSMSGKMQKGEPMSEDRQVTGKLDIWDALSKVYNMPDVPDEAKSIIGDVMLGLPSAQAEQTYCEYCHEDFEGYVRPIEKNSHLWLVRRGRTMRLRVCFKGEYRECDILFCPMCGRRLTDG